MGVGHVRKIPVCGKFPSETLFSPSIRSNGSITTLIRSRHPPSGQGSLTLRAVLYLTMLPAKHVGTSWTYSWPDDSETWYNSVSASSWIPLIHHYHLISSLSPSLDPSILVSELSDIVAKMALLLSTFPTISLKLSNNLRTWLNISSIPRCEMFQSLQVMLILMFWILDVVRRRGMKLTTSHLSDAECFRRALFERSWWCSARVEIQGGLHALPPLQLPRRRTQILFS